MFIAKVCLLMSTVLFVSGAFVDFELQKPQLDGRIVGGFEIDITQVPWQASLQTRGQHFCGASIISEKWLLTAAHCTAAVPNAKNILVRIGSSLYSKGGEIHKVKRIVQHENYNSKTIDYDFSLLELQESIEFNEYAKTVALPNQEEEKLADNTMTLVTGWGDTHSSESRLKLRGAEVPIVNQEKCMKAYQRFGGVTPRMICAGFDKGGKDACQGDSGGPLVAFDKSNENPKLVGVVSWGYGCAKPHYPGVYSRVTEAREWINEHTNEEVKYVFENLRVYVNRSINSSNRLRRLVWSNRWWCSYVHKNNTVSVGTSFNNRGGEKINALKIIRHQNYSRESLDYDIAVIELADRLKLSNSIQAIALPKANESFADNSMCLVSGWGDTQLPSAFRFQRNALRAVEVPIVNQEKCNNDYKMLGGITPRMMCAGYDFGGFDACAGDSGGPLACIGQNKTPKLCGIVSWGYECAAPHFTGVYTRVQVLLDWIKEKTVYRPKPQLDGRIVGGFPMNITQAPYQVSFQMYSRHICGGSIISSNWIVTAAHCVSPDSFKDDLSIFQIRAGSTSRSNDGELINIKRIIRHEKYDNKLTDFDYALVELVEPLQLDETKKVVKLHNFDEIFPENTTLLVTGWGDTHNLSESRSQLRGTEVPLLNQKICQIAYNEEILTPRMLCAGFEKGGKDACQGDSGGPLVAFSQDDGEPKLVGIVSWGYGCAEPEYPGVYSRVLAARNWIYTHTGIYFQKFLSSSYSKSDGKIVGGFPIEIEQAPWQVSLQRRGTHICGGSIISPNWIATAGHCVSGAISNFTALKIRAGSSFHAKDGEVLNIKQIVLHEKYDRNVIDFDYALIELQEPLQLDKSKKVIELHNFDEVFPDNTTTLVTGWGNTKNNSESNDQLRGAEVPIVNQIQCQNAYENRISARMICAGFLEQGGRDSCQGDSGGPLVAFSQDDGEPKLVGIVSWGRGCAEPKFPGVYSRVLAARDWIYTHMHQPKPQLDGRIVGGFAIGITQAPYQVSLQYRESHLCGGSIISPTWIATAAHCTERRSDNLSILKIRAGSSFYGKDGELLDVKRVVQHANFSMKTVDFDYSLIELVNPIQLDETKQVIKLHNFDEVFPDNTTSFVSGWGNTHNSSESRLQLRGAEVPLVNQKKCHIAYARYGGVSPRMICAGFYENGGKDACQGDSGGPLVAFSQDGGEPRLVGIVSWGEGCAKPLYPGVYSRVLAARDWIYTHTGI
ncbi:polyserase-2-like [Contarinia nasturtii]|uniref:polyserase-2-like n=1 Tax=Contarinia nasturtii TaxID=265458 RepID=UPI0012D49F8F|nr:polyserase-2-like [Contarinia nasturtii]